MKQLFPLAWAGLKSRKRSTVLLLVTIILSVMFLVVMGLIGTSSLYTIDLQNKDLYGEQKAVAWNLSDEQKTQFEKSTVWDEIGKITVYGTAASETGDFLGVGTMDETARKLGHIRLTEGRWPQAEDEIVLEKSVYKYIGNQPYAVGEPIALEITIAGQEAPQTFTFQVVGLIENYAAVWRNAYVEYTQEGNFYPPLVSFLITEQGTVSSGTAMETWLLNSPSESYAVLSHSLPEKVTLTYNYSVYPQISYYGGLGEETINTIGISALIGSMILVCMMVILLNGFLMSVDRRKRQLSLLRCIGATKKQAYSYLFCEAFLLLGMGIPVGILLGVPISVGAVKLFGMLNGSELTYRFSGWILLLAALVCVACVCLATLFPAVRASRIAPIAGTRTVYFKRKKSQKKKPGKMTLKPFGLMLLSMRKSKGKTALTTLTFALVIVVFNVMMMTDIVEYQLGSSYERADASLTALEISAEKQQGLLWKNNSKADAIPVSVFSDFRKLPDVACQNAAIIPMFYCRIPFSRYDPYLNGYFRFDYKMLGARNWKKWGQYNYFFEKQTPYGYTEQEYLAEPQITIFDDTLLAEFQPYVTDGAVNIDAINRGEEIILCMPDYYSVVQEEENSIQTGTWIPNGKADIPKDAKLLKNTNWKAGDTLTFTWPEEQGQGYTLHDRTVKIGAIVKSGPQIEHSANGVFCMAVGEKTLENLKVPYEISNTYIYFDEDADIPATEARLEQAASHSYPLTRLTTQTEEALAEQQQRRTRLAISNMIAVCLLALGFLGLMNTVSSRIHGRLHEIGLLRCIGMTKGQVYRMFVYEGTVFGVLASLLGIAGCLVMLPKFQENWLHTPMPLYLVLSCFVCIALAVCTIFLPVRAILKKNPTEITQINE